MKSTGLLLLIAIFSLATFKCSSQTKHHQLIQLSGVVVEHDSLQTIPYVAIIIKNSTRGTITDNNGYYSFIVIPGDTIEFSAIGFKSNQYIIPDTLSGDKYAHIHLMQRDTISLKPFVFTSWPSKEAFKSAFLKLDLPDNDLARAKRNMLIAAEKARLEGNRMDARGNFYNTAQQEYDKLYYAGQYPPNNLLNPISWARFIQAWKAGSLNIQ